MVTLTGRTCQFLGFSPGCCSISPSSSCYVPEATCYCDPTCHANGDCCIDVTIMQCPARTQRSRVPPRGSYDTTIYIIIASSETLPAFQVVHRSWEDLGMRVNIIMNIIMNILGYSLIVIIIILLLIYSGDYESTNGKINGKALIIHSCLY